MTSSLFRSRPQYLPIPKFYGYQTLKSVDEQNELIERLLRPTKSKLQADLENRDFNKSTKNHRFPDNPNQSKSISLGPVSSCRTILYPLDQWDGNQSKKELNDDVQNELYSSSSINSTTRINEKCIVDLTCNTNGVGRYFVDSWNLDTNRMTKLMPKSACPKGEQLLREEFSNHWLCHPIRFSHLNTPIASARSRVTQKLYDWNIIKRIARRLHNTGTQSSNIRLKQSREIILNLTNKQIESRSKPLDSMINSKLNLSKPEFQMTWFDQNGEFELIKYIDQWERVQGKKSNLIQLSRPTTASKIKNICLCLICEQNPNEKTPLGIVGPRAHTLQSLRTARDSKSHANQRLTRVTHPPIVSHAEQRVCPRFEKLILNKCGNCISNNAPPSNICLNGQSWLIGLEGNGEKLPLVSGLERSSTVNAIIERLHGAKLQKTKGKH